MFCAVSVPNHVEAIHSPPPTLETQRRCPWCGYEFPKEEAKIFRKRK